MPTTSNDVLVGVNSTILGNISVGDNVLTLLITYVNCDISSHSIVFGNPCIIKCRDKTTEEYMDI